jgi:hypothetical protein
VGLGIGEDPRGVEAHQRPAAVGGKQLDVLVHCPVAQGPQANLAPWRAGEPPRRPLHAVEGVEAPGNPVAVEPLAERVGRDLGAEHHPGVGLEQACPAEPQRVREAGGGRAKRGASPAGGDVPRQPGEEDEEAQRSQQAEQDPHQQRSDDHPWGRRPATGLGHHRQALGQDGEDRVHQEAEGE